MLVFLFCPWLLHMLVHCYHVQINSVQDPFAESPGKVQPSMEAMQLLALRFHGNERPGLLSSNMFVYIFASIKLVNISESILHRHCVYNTYEHVGRYAMDQSGLLTMLGDG